jgi:uncharacterized cupredoxin-like copper-binding protein
MTRFTTKALIATASTSALLLFGACGSDDDSSAGNDAACAAWFNADSTLISYIFMDQGDAESVTAALDEAIDAADSEFEQTLIDLKTAAQPALQDPESADPEEALGLYGQAIVWAGENCDVVTLDVTAVDFGYEGVPDELAAGYHVVNFTNAGHEQHEMFTFRFNEGTTETFEEIVDLPEEEVFTKITPVNAVFAMPGGSDTTSWNLTEPGRYAIVCFIPVGSVGETDGDGPPHFTEGMFREFNVTS